MPPIATPANVTRKTFTEILSRYPSTIAAVSTTNPISRIVGPNSPAGAQIPLETLDAWRLNTLPETLQSRKKPFLTKDEAEMLLACKLRRGKRRAGLPKLLAANSPELIQSATTSAFAHLTAAQTTPPSTDTIIAALKILVDAIRGVGPATASYILALIAPGSVPVFSDEGYRWALYTKRGMGNDGWGRDIKYDLKEYRIYLDAIKALTTKLGPDITAQDIEKVGFLLGKEASTVGGIIGGESTAAAKKRLEASKKLAGVETLDAALGVEAEPTGAPVVTGAQGTTAPGSGPVPPAFSVGARTLQALAANKSKRKKPVDPYGPDVDIDDTPLPRRRKTRASAPKEEGKKIGWVFVGTKK